MIQSKFKKTKEQHINLTFLTPNQQKNVLRQFRNIQIDKKIIKVSLTYFFTFIITSQNEIYAIQNQQSQKYEQKELYSQKVQGWIKLNNQHCKFLTNLNYGYSHCILWNQKQIYGWVTSKIIKSMYAIGYSPQLSQKFDLYMKPRKIPFFIPNDEKIQSVKCGNFFSIIHCGNIFYAMGDNEKGELGFILKRILVQPQILNMYSYLDDNRNKIVKQRIQVLKCGNQFIIALDKEGCMYGCGNFKKLGIKTQQTSKNGLFPLYFNNYQQKKNEKISVRAYECSQSILLLTNENKLFLITQKSHLSILNPQLYVPIDFHGQLQHMKLYGSIILFKNTEGEYFWKSYEILKLEKLVVQDNTEVQLGYNYIVTIANKTVQQTQGSYSQIKYDKENEQRQAQRLKNQKIVSLEQNIKGLKNQIQEQKQIISLYELYTKKLQKQIKNNRQVQSNAINHQQLQDPISSLQQIQQTQHIKVKQKFRDLKYIIRGLINNQKYKIDNQSYSYF